MADGIWDPERIVKVGNIMAVAAKRLKVGDKIRTGIRSDPCRISDGDIATVEEIIRGSDGFVKFTASVDSNNLTIELDNRNVSPERVWELVETESAAQLQTNKTSLETDIEQLESGEIKDLHKTLAGIVREICGDILRVYGGSAPIFALYYADRHDKAYMSAQQDDVVLRESSQVTD